MNRRLRTFLLAALALLCVLAGAAVVAPRTAPPGAVASPQDAEGELVTSETPLRSPERHLAEVGDQAAD